ncbi:hypothetical protein [Microbacterium sp. EST19A]|uniref:hypothetical protein n=1 Tax=Microbacterium sp. EST19A TaxID=2862681 RepID=UPI001CBDC7F2|nr:hypothetical protein [Microbacterium sp. EST19A]
MAERETFEDAGYIRYSDMLDRLQQRFPDIATRRVAQIVAAEIDAITGGVPPIVPAEVETGASEMLEREHLRARPDGEVA